MFKKTSRNDFGNGHSQVKIENEKKDTNSSFNYFFQVYIIL